MRAGTVVVPPAPAEEIPATDFRVTVSGQRITSLDAGKFAQNEFVRKVDIH